mmetsp:Transcript_781/g.1496  ORF Transcript_781/g.1496 Transcript_781/m.1496 type:complete len:80 (-) Transcript_781:1214-1453(-)
MRASVKLTEKLPGICQGISSVQRANKFSKSAASSNEGCAFSLASVTPLFSLSGFSTELAATASCFGTASMASSSKEASD